MLLLARLAGQLISSYSYARILTALPFLPASSLTSSMATYQHCVVLSYSAPSSSQPPKMVILTPAGPSPWERYSSKQLAPLLSASVGKLSQTPFPQFNWALANRVEQKGCCMPFKQRCTSLMRMSWFSHLTLPMHSTAYPDIALPIASTLTSTSPHYGVSSTSLTLNTPTFTSIIRAAYKMSFLVEKASVKETSRLPFSSP